MSWGVKLTHIQHWYVHILGAQLNLKRQKSIPPKIIIRTLGSRLLLSIKIQISTIIPGTCAKLLFELLNIND